MCTEQLRHYKKLIDCMPVNAQTTIAKLDTWQRGRGCDDPDLRAIVKRFAKKGGNGTVEISRKDLFDVAREGKGVSRQLICAVYIWAYPTGGRGDNRSRVIRNIKKVETAFRETSPHMGEGDLRQLCAELHGCGIGVSTWTKLLYFSRFTVDSNQALILDSKIIRTFQRRLFGNFDVLAEKRIRYDNAAIHYGAYLREMTKVAASLEVGADKLEMFLFTFGNSLKNRS